MNRFEYKYLRHEGVLKMWFLNDYHLEKCKGCSLIEVLNKLGQDGWELTLKEEKEIFILKRGC